MNSSTGSGSTIAYLKGSGDEDYANVLVAGRSNVTRVVVMKIVERCGLRSISATPETAIYALRDRIPHAVILDGGISNHDCDRLIEDINALCDRKGSPIPPVILLSNRTGTPETLDLSVLVEAVVPKPITPETLQPVVERLAARYRAN